MLIYLLNYQIFQLINYATLFVKVFIAGDAVKVGINHYLLANVIDVHDALDTYRPHNLNKALDEFMML